MGVPAMGRLSHDSFTDHRSATRRSGFSRLHTGCRMSQKIASFRWQAKSKKVINSWEHKSYHQSVSYLNTTVSDPRGRTNREFIRLNRELDSPNRELSANPRRPRSRSKSPVPETHRMQCLPPKMDLCAATYRATEIMPISVAAWCATEPLIS